MKQGIPINIAALTASSAGEANTNFLPDPTASAFISFWLVVMLAALIAAALLTAVVLIIKKRKFDR